MPENPTSTDFRTAFAALSEQLACPACYGELRLNADHLICTNCGVAYPIVDGIPALIAGTREQGTGAPKQ